MNRLPRMIVAGVAGSLLLAAGCSRREPQPAPPAREEAPPAKPSALRQQFEQLLAGAKGQTRSNRLRPQAAAVQKDEDGAHAELALPLAEPSDAQGVAPGAQSAKRSTVSVASTDPATHGPRRPGNSKPKGSKRQEADALFDNPSLLRIQIQIPQAGMSALRTTRQDNRRDRPVAKATIREGGVVYTNVAVHLKAGVGSFRPVDGKPALTLNFDKFATGQSFHGLHKISLNNSVQDSTYLNEKIGRELFVAAGVPTPRASHATVELNGRYLGLYVLLEGANKQFLKNYFDNPNGNLYDGGFCRDIRSGLTVNCGEDPKNHSGLNALRAAVRAGDYAALEKALDVDRFVSMLALEFILSHWDGYTSNRNNWRVYHDLESNRMIFIPHGLDQLFGGGGRAVGGLTDPYPKNVQGDVSRIVLSSPEGRKRYRERLSQIYTNVFKVDEIAARIDEIGTGVSAALAETDPQSARSFQQRANALKTRVIRRGTALRSLFGEPVHPQDFASDGVLKLAGWTKSLSQSGDPVLSESRDASGNRILVINAGDSASSSSWRTRVVLAAGTYQFEGRIRVKGVTIEEGDQRSGAGLRVSKSPMPKKLTGTSDWKDFKYRFNVAENGADTELVCELKATEGEAWFDASSLRLIKFE